MQLHVMSLQGSNSSIILTVDGLIISITLGVDVIGLYVELLISGLWKWLLQRIVHHFGYSVKSTTPGEEQHCGAHPRPPAHPHPGMMVSLSPALSVGGSASFFPT